MRVYLDNAATTPIREEVIQAMVPFMQNYYGNPSSIHAEGRKVRAAIEGARKTVAETLGASIGEIFFTSGGTESNNTALKCAVRDLGVTRFITSPTEHHAVLHSLDCIQQQHDNISVEFLEIDAIGCPDMQQLKEKLSASTEKTLVTLMHANNEIGTMIDLNEVSEICKEHGALFHTDSVQTVGHFPIDLSKTSVSFLTGAAHKFHGPKGVGFLYINSENHIQPFIDGGSQERNMRGGTENVYGIVGLATALKTMNDHIDKESEHIRSLSSYMRKCLVENIPGVAFNGNPEGRALYTVLSVSFPPSDRNEMLLMSLDISGISASGGSACSSGVEASSHVLQAINADPSRKTVRFSFSAFNTKEEVDFVLNEIYKLFPAHSAVAR